MYIYFFIVCVCVHVCLSCLDLHWRYCSYWDLPWFWAPRPLNPWDQSWSWDSLGVRVQRSPPNVLGMWGGAYKIGGESHGFATLGVRKCIGFIGTLDGFGLRIPSKQWGPRSAFTPQKVQVAYSYEQSYSETKADYTPLLYGVGDCYMSSTASADQQAEHKIRNQHVNPNKSYETRKRHRDPF